MRSLRLALLMLAAGCASEEKPGPSAPPPVKPAGPVQRLADPDPAVSAAAREDLLALDDFSVPNLRAEADKPENAATRDALREIADTIETRTLAVAREWESRPRFGSQLSFDLFENSAVPPCAVFLRWMTDAEEIEDPQARSGIGPSSVRALGLAWLRAYTFASIGDDPAEWRTFLEKYRGCPASEMRRQALIRRGYAILDPDPVVAARAYLRIGDPGKLKVSRPGTWNSEGTENFLYQAYTDLLAEVFAFHDSGSGSSPHLQQALDWIQLNERWFAWENGRLVSKAGPDEFLSVYHEGSANLRLAALGELRRWPDRIPTDAWSLVDASPSLVAHAMHCAGIPAPREALPAILTALGPANDPRELAKIWNLGDLEALAQDSAASTETRAEAVRVLATLDDERGLALCTSILKSGKDRRLVSAAILACTRFPGNAGLATAEAWLASAADGPDRFDVAIALARRGRRPGFDVVLQRAGKGLLDRRRAALVREFVEGAPEEEHDDQWDAWAATAGELAWDPALQKWRRKE